MKTSREIIKAAYLYDPDLKGISVYNGEITFWDSSLAQPTDEQIVQYIAEYKYDEEVKAYQQQRQSEYPQIGEQLDKIYHGTLASKDFDLPNHIFSFLFVNFKFFINLYLLFGFC